MTWCGLYLPLHNYFFIHEVHLHSLPLTKSSAGEHHSQDYHMTLRSRFSQWVQLTDRPRGRSLASHSRALGKYQERKRGKKERGRNCSHGLWKRIRWEMWHSIFRATREPSLPRSFPCIVACSRCARFLAMSALLFLPIIQEFSRPRVTHDGLGERGTTHPPLELFCSVINTWIKKQTMTFKDS